MFKLYAITRAAQPALVGVGEFSLFQDLFDTCDLILLHRYGDHKYIYFSKPADLIPDPKGRVKGQPYIKDGMEIYDVMVDMYASPGHKDETGDEADVWVGTEQEVVEQLRAMRSGKGGGTNFMKIIKPSEEVVSPV